MNVLFCYNSFSLTSLLPTSFILNEAYNSVWVFLLVFLYCSTSLVLKNLPLSDVTLIKFKMIDVRELYVLYFNILL